MDCRRQASQSNTNSQSSLKLMFIESVMLSKCPILCCPLLLLPSIFPNIKVISSESVLCITWPKYWTQDLFLLRLTGLISLQSKGLSRVFSNTTVQKHQLFGAQLSYGPTLTTIHDYWEKHSFDQMDLYWQDNVSAF